MKRTLEPAMTAAVVLAALVLAAACGNSSTPSPVSPSSAAPAVSSPGQPSQRVEVAGKIASINAPSRSFQVATTTVVVPASVALSTNSGQMEFKDLQVEMEIHVVGTLEDNVVKAEEVKVDDHGNGRQPDPGDAMETEFMGAIASMSGTCPNLTLSVGGKTVKTSGATSFLKAVCAALGPRDTVEIKGTAQGDGTVMASRVQMEDDQGEPEPGENEVEFTGLVTSATGSCPSLSLRIAGHAVQSTSSTEFKNGSCADVKPNATMLEVKGMAAAGGMITATRLKFEK